MHVDTVATHSCARSHPLFSNARPFAATLSQFAPVLGEIIADAVERCAAGSETHAGTRARFAWRRPANSADLAKKEASRFYSPDETVQLRAKL